MVDTVLRVGKRKHQCTSACPQKLTGRRRGMHRLHATLSNQPSYAVAAAPTQTVAVAPRNTGGQLLSHDGTAKPTNKQLPPPATSSADTYEVASSP